MTKESLKKIVDILYDKRDSYTDETDRLQDAIIYAETDEALLTAAKEYRENELKKDEIQALVRELMEHNENHEKALKTAKINGIHMTMQYLEDELEEDTNNYDENGFKEDETMEYYMYVEEKLTSMI